MSQELTNTFAAITADGNSAAVTLPGLFNVVSLYFGTATWGGGTLIGQVSPDGGTTYLAVPSLTMTSGTANTKKADYVVIGGPTFRFNVAGATNPNLVPTIRAVEQSDGIVFPLSFTANGTSETFKFPLAPATFGWAAWGTWDSGTATLQASPNGGTTWFAVDTMTANGMKHVATNTDTLFRVVLSGATAPALSVRLYARNNI